MELGLTNKVALVLGGAGGLGRAIGTALAREGARVALADIDAAGLEAAESDLRSRGYSVMSLPWDLADLRQIDANVRQVEEKWGPVQVLVNNTGGPPPSPVSGVSEETWTGAFQSMVLPVIAITDRVLPQMREAGWGRVITSASSGVVAPIPALGISNVMRSALVGWSKTLASEEAPHGITVNVTVPGRIATARITYLDEQRARREGKTVDDVRSASHAAIPAARYGEPEEYAAAVAFLASEAASYTTGSVVRIDGGFIAST